MPSSTATRIFNGTLSSSGENITNPFSSSSFLYIVAPDTTDDYEIDTFLNVKLGSIVRLVPFGTYQSSTRDLIVIPQGFRNSGLELRLILIADTSINIEVWEISTDCCGKEQLDSIETKLNLVGIGTAATLANQLAQDLALEAISVGLGTALLPITGGLSAALPATTTPILLPASTAVSTVLSALPTLIGLPL